MSKEQSGIADAPVLAQKDKIFPVAMFCNCGNIIDMRFLWKKERSKGESFCQMH